MTPGHTYVIAEAGVNHNGSLALALELVDAAADAGADAVKFQTFKADRLASPEAPKASYQMASTDPQESQHAMLKRLELTEEMHFAVKARAEQRGITFLSTAFDEESLRFLVELGMPLFKVPSGELTNAPLLWRFARTGRPLVLSTGMASLADVETALAVVTHALLHEQEPDSIDTVLQTWSDPQARQRLQGHVTLLHCTSQYPTPMDQVNLKAMDTLKQAFGLPVGYSDHTMGTLIPMAAVVRGACLIEKHFTMDRSLPGPDHQASLEPHELAVMVAQVREIQQALGDGLKVPQPSEWSTRTAARQRVVAARPIRAGQLVQREDLCTARHQRGLPPTALWSLIGRPAPRDLDTGSPWEL